MQPENQEASLQTLQEIRGIMDRSARFITLSGWSGIWAGATALVGSYIAHTWLRQPQLNYRAPGNDGTLDYFNPFINRFILLAIIVLIVALAGGAYFTYRKTKAHGGKLWNSASRQLLWQMVYPLFAGGVFGITFIYYGCTQFVAPACLIFYGLALIGGSKYLFSEIRYLGILEVVLGCLSLYYTHAGLYFWALGFGVLHVFYGAIMWDKYDK